MWFTDGGVTSNFPIHFFDQPLPEWPTFGINLAPHPKGFENQDVWLPSDWQSRTSPASPLAASMVSFAGAIVNTARGWRDTTQTFMPAFRGRVAWVRQRKDEGGANLFMTPDQIASLALRGALAGARLRRRFGTDEQWRRHQWIRFRVALDNLDRLQRGVGSALGRPAYSTFVDSAALNDLETTFSDHPSLGDPDPPGRGNPPAVRECPRDPRGTRWCAQRHHRGIRPRRRPRRSVPGHRNVHASSNGRSVPRSRAPPSAAAITGGPLGHRIHPAIGRARRLRARRHDRRIVPPCAHCWRGSVDQLTFADVGRPTSLTQRELINGAWGRAMTPALRSAPRGGSG